MPYVAYRAELAVVTDREDAVPFRSPVPARACNTMSSGLGTSNANDLAVPVTLGGGITLFFLRRWGWLSAESMVVEELLWVIVVAAPIACFHCVLKSGPIQLGSSIGGAVPTDTTL